MQESKQKFITAGTLVFSLVELLGLCLLFFPQGIHSSRDIRAFVLIAVLSLIAGLIAMTWLWHAMEGRRRR